MTSGGVWPKPLLRARERERGRGGGGGGGGGNEVLSVTVLYTVSMTAQV